jgi:WD40 repeat protein
MSYPRTDVVEGGSYRRRPRDGIRDPETMHLLLGWLEAEWDARSEALSQQIRPPGTFENWILALALALIDTIGPADSGAAPFSDTATLPSLDDLLQQPWAAADHLEVMLWVAWMWARGLRRKPQSRRLQVETERIGLGGETLRELLDEADPAFASFLPRTKHWRVRTVPAKPAPPPAPERPQARPTAPAPFLVPFPHDRHFVGRQQELSDLHALLQEDAAVGVCPTMLSGMGGIGKTQLAVEYAYVYRASYPGGVFWVNATASEQARSVEQAWQAEMARLALAVGLTAGDVAESERQARLSRAFAAYLEGRPDALLVFDNVEDPRSMREADAGFVPAELGCRLLFTTRRREASLHFSTLEIRVLDEDAAVSLLLTNAERAEPPPLDLEISPVRAICRALGCLPLAIVLAGAYLGRFRQITFEGYLERLALRGALPTIDASQVDPRDLSTRHAAAVAATLRLQWEALDSVEGRRVLQVAALLGEAAQIPRARLSLLSGLLDNSAPGYPAPLDEALVAARRLCLVEELDAHEVRLHPLVREFAAGTIADRAALGESCATLLHHAYHDPARLEEAVGRRSIDQVLEDVRAALTLDLTAAPARDAGDPPSSFVALAELAGVLDLETHNVRSWRPAHDPSFFLQQLRNCCFERGLDDLRRLAEDRLAHTGRTYLAALLPTSRTSRALMRTLAGHAAPVCALALTPDGRHAISGSRDTTLRLWDIASGSLIRTLERHRAEVTGVAVSSDGRFAVSSSRDGTLRVWNLATRRTVRILDVGAGGLNAVAMVDHGPVAIAAADSGELSVWLIERGERVRALRGHAGPARYLASARDGRLVLSSAKSGPAILWDVAGERALAEFEAPGGITALALSADGRTAITGAENGALTIWNLPGATIAQRLEGHTAEVTSVAFAPEPGRVISTSRDTTVRLWDLAEGERDALRGHSAWVSAAAATPDRRAIVSASWDTTVKVWSLDEHVRAPFVDGHRDWIGAVAIASDGRIAVSASADRTLIIWDLAGRRALRTLAGHEGRVLGVAVAGDRIVSSSEDRTLIVWDLASGSRVHTLRGHAGAVRCVAMADNGRLAVSGADDSSLIVWDLHEGRAMRTLEGHADAVNAVAMTPDASLAVSASRDETVWAWSPASGAARVLGRLSETGLGIAVSADGRLAASVAEDGEIATWNLDADEPQAVLGRHADRAHGVVMSPDGRVLITASHDRSLRVWDLEHRRRILEARVEAPLRCCAAFPILRTIVAGDDRGALHLFERVTPGANPGASADQHE